MVAGAEDLISWACLSLKPSAAAPGGLVVFTCIYAVTLIRVLIYLNDIISPRII